LIPVSVKKIKKKKKEKAVDKPVEPIRTATGWIRHHHHPRPATVATTVAYPQPEEARVAGSTATTLDIFWILP